MLNLQKTLFTLLLAGTTGIASAQIKTDTITPQSRKLITSALKPGLRQYLVYMQQPAKNKVLGLSYWVRNIQQAERKGEKVIITSQHWYSPDTLGYRTVYSVNRAADFAPIYHTETLRNHTRAYNWSPDKVTGADTVAANEFKTFSLATQASTFNWNLDIETFEQLPLAAGKAFAIHFYDAGLGEPKYVLYTVTGSEVLPLLNNTRVDCWKLLTEGKAPNGTPYTQTFWISKKGHEFIKEEDNFGGNMRTKIKLPGATPDVLAKFK